MNARPILAVPALLMSAALFVEAEPDASGLEALSGVYEYVYEHNTPDLKENHHIELDAGKIPPAGTYYGTSDDFDDAREGYLPGFFKAPMTGLELSSTTIRFRLVLKPADMRTKAVTPFTKGDAGESWDIRLSRQERTYSGRIDGKKIILQPGPPFGDRVFVKRGSRPSKRRPARKAAPPAPPLP